MFSQAHSGRWMPQVAGTGVRTALPDAQVIELPIADGGEGTVEAMVAATGGTIIPARVTGPLGEPVKVEMPHAYSAGTSHE